MKIKKFLGTDILSLSSVSVDSKRLSMVLIGTEEMPESTKTKR